MKIFRQFLSPAVFSCLLSLLALFLFPEQVLSGAKKGLTLWFEIVLPTLLPFLITTSLCMELQIPDLLPPCFYPVFTGLLSGYPIGAKACADLCRTGQLSLTEGQLFLSFCNNASPMFVLNYLCLQSLCLKGKLFLPLLIFYSSSFLSGFLFYLFHKKDLQKQKKGREQRLVSDALPFFPALDASILTGFTIITKIGGYIILFSILAAFVSSWLPGPLFLKGAVIGLLEITTGISYLSSLSIPQGLLITLCLAVTSFGGLSSAAQTNSVIAGSGLSLFTYLKYKALAAGLCTGLCILFFF